MSYSQSGEESAILEIFGNRVGRFLDIGACDGRWHSNTLALVERGWSGVCVEPSPWSFCMLYERHSSNEKLALVNAAVDFVEGVSQFYDSPTAVGYSTLAPRNWDRWTQLIGKFGKFFVNTLSVKQLLEAFPGPYDFVSLDTEGTSASIFVQLPLDILLTSAVCVEHDGSVIECREHARNFGFREVFYSAENLIFVREAT